MANIRILVLLVIAGFFGITGCSSSGGSTDDDYVTDTQSEESVPAADTASLEIQTPPRSLSAADQQRFNVQADTVTVQSRKKGKVTTAPVQVKSSVKQKKYYSVQIGAFRLKSNADRNVLLLQKRFRLPVIKFFEKGIRMERVCIGHFSSIKEARTFLRSIQQKYPKEYHDAWIAGLTK